MLAADWNWFFSSLAQSAAAIVGLFGAFIVTKVLSNEVTFSEKRGRIREALGRSERLMDDAGSLAFEWFVTRVADEALRDLKRRWRDDGKLPPPEELYEEGEFSIFMPRSTAIELIRTSVHHWDEQRKERESARQQMPFGLDPNYDMASLVPQVDIHAAVEKERDAIDLVLRDVKAHMRAVADLLAQIRTNPESSTHITYALIGVTVLFFVGVIYPLSFMPTSGDVELDFTVAAFFANVATLRGALLMATSAAFSFLLGMFFIFNKRMKYDPSDIQRLEACTEISHYSEHFAIMEENERRHDQQLDSNAPNAP